MALEEPAGALVDPAAVLEERPAHEGSAALADPAAVFEERPAHAGSAAALEEPAASSSHRRTPGPTTSPW